VDLPPHTRSGLVDAVSRLKKIPGIGIAHLTKSDIVRHPLVQQIVHAYDEMPRGSAGKRGRR
jgi:phosphate starvation-inducible PhoH-like protein